MTVTGNGTGGSPTGSVTFSVCGPLSSASGCTSGGTAIGSAVGLTAGADDTATATSASSLFLIPGIYCFRADYSGDGNYTSSSDGSSDECFTVALLSSTTTSAPTSANISLGDANTDGATVTGDLLGGTPTGTVTFSACGPLTSATGCASGGTAMGSAVTVTAGANDTATATSPAYTPESPGTYCFRADYSGDGSYTASTDGSATDECFTVGKASSTTASIPKAAAISLGTTDTDTATVNGNATGGSPTGTVTFSECGPLSSVSGCASGGTTVGSPVSLTAGPDDTATATSPAFVATAAGIYCFRADYSGDSSYTASSDGATAECFTVSIATAAPGPPTATIITPANGATYVRSSTVRASYTCQDAPGGPGISKCEGDVANGAAIDTATPGVHAFGVVAVSADGQVGIDAVIYRVVLPSNHFTVSHLTGHADGTITLDVTVPGPGTIDLLVSAWDDNLASAASLNPARGRFVYGRGRASVKRGRTIALTVRPDARGKLLLAHHAYPIVLRLWVTYTPAHGVSHSMGFYGIRIP